MSAVRLPGSDGRIVLVPVDDGAVGRISFTRYGTRGGTIYGPCKTPVGDDTVRKDPDNGAVKATEYRGPR